MTLAGLSAVFLFEMLDNSLLNVALPTIGRERQRFGRGASRMARQVRRSTTQFPDALPRRPEERKDPY